MWRLKKVLQGEKIEKIDLVRLTSVKSIVYLNMIYVRLYILHYCIVISIIKYLFLVSTMVSIVNEHHHDVHIDVLELE